MILPFVSKLYASLVYAVTLVHQSVLALIAPPVCARCKTSICADDVLCIPCLSRVHKISTHTLAITKTYAITVFAASKYEDIVQELIRAKQQRKIYAARLLGTLIWQQTDLRNQQFDYIVPVPLHWRRYAERGYNQAHEIARVLSKKSGKPVLNCIQRIRATRIQAGLSAEERATNVTDAFVIPERFNEKIRGVRILMVDDVLTTGSTMKACVRALRMKRPSLIIAAVAARVV